MRPLPTTALALAAQTGAIPDRASVEEDSPFYWARGALVDVWFEGNKRGKYDVVEYCISEGWVRIGLRNGRGEFLKERGRFVTTPKRFGKVQVVPIGARP